MYTKPLSYDSLKCVLQYLEPNKRFHVANNCPSIRTAERLMPFKLDHLMFSEGKVKINNTTYKLGIIRKYNNDLATPTTITSENESGGVPYEVDKFGVTVDSDERTLYPGDVDIKLVSIAPGHIPPREQTTEEMIEELEDDIRYHGSRPLRQEDWEGWLEHLEISQLTLTALQYRKGNVTPPYQNFIQLTINTPGEETVIERYVHNMKYSGAMKHLGECFFDRNRRPIYVKHFQLNGIRLVLRVPLGVKFHIEKLEMSAKPGLALEALQPIIHKSSYPLKGLIIKAYEAQDVTHPIVREARALQLNTIEIYRNDAFLPILNSISNKLVHIKYNDRLDTEYLVTLINNWITSHRMIGTEFLFRHLHLMISEMVWLKERFNGKLDNEGYIILPKSTSSQICIGHVQIAGLDGSFEQGVRLSVIAKL